MKTLHLTKLKFVKFASSGALREKVHIFLVSDFVIVLLYVSSGLSISLHV